MEFYIVMLAGSYLNPSQDLDIVFPNAMTKDEVTGFISRIKLMPELMDSYVVSYPTHGRISKTWNTWHWLREYGETDG